MCHSMTITFEFYIFQSTASHCFKKSQLSGETSKDNDPRKINQWFDLPG